MHTQVLASIAGDFHATHWNGVANEDAYVQTATQSLLTYFRNFGLAGFDINYESFEQGKTDQWVRVWCRIIASLKQVSLRAIKA